MELLPVDLQPFRPGKQGIQFLQALSMCGVEGLDIGIGRGNVRPQGLDGPNEKLRVQAGLLRERRSLIVEERCQFVDGREHEPARVVVSDMHLGRSGDVAFVLKREFPLRTLPSNPRQA